MLNLSKTQKTISVILKLIIIASAIIGTYICAFVEKGSFMGGKVVFMYFTIQSNLLIALICLVGLIRMKNGEPTGVVWHVIKLVGTVSITLTGFVFCFILAPVLGAGAWNLQGILTHVIVPVCSILDFFVVSTAMNLEKRHSVYVAIPPLLYVAFAAVGYVKNWQFGGGLNYPYFFLNWGSPCGAFGFSGELPFIGTGWWIIVLLVFLTVISLIYIKIAEILKRVANNRD